MKPLADCQLYTFVDTAFLQGRQPDAIAQQLCQGGSDVIQLRAKTSTVDQIRRMADAILPITRAANVEIQWFAIGGINLQNLDDVLEAGAERICVVSAILNAPDVAEACHQFKERLLSAR